MNTGETRVMATVTATIVKNRDLMERMHAAGMEGVRINSAHIEPSDMPQLTADIRHCCPGITVLMDTKGPEMRTTALGSPLTLRDGDRIRIISDTDDTPSTPECIRINVPDLEKHLSIGQTIRFDDGAITATISAIEGNSIELTILSGGILGSRKTMTAENFDSRYLPAISRRDGLNIRAAVEAGIDIIAHSFVRSADDVRAVKELIRGSDVKVYAKIECQQALDNLDEIIREADGILVARGDLGTAIDPCLIPAVQADVILRCRRAGRPTIVATQILQSMTTSPRPTRAELSDIALGVMERTDWLLLCGETAQGQYPVECIDIMKRTIEITAKHNLQCKIS